MAASRKQISYNPLMEAEILKIVKVTGAHLAEHGKVTEKWSEVNDLVFKSDFFQQYKADHFKTGNITKVKSKYEAITKAALNTMGWGDFCGGKSANLSGYSGDLASVASLVKDIQIEIENHEAITALKAADAAAQKVKLASISKEVFDTKPKPEKTPRQRSLDGTILDRASSVKGPRKSDTELRHK